MARQIVVLGLIFLAIVSIVSTANANGEPGPELPTAAELGHAEAPSDDIGTTDANDDAAPVGGPVPAGAFSGSSSESRSGAPGASAASALEFSTVAGIAATAAGAAFFL